MTWTPEELGRWVDRHAVDRNGKKIGTIADVYVDDETGQPEWLAVMTGLFGSRMSFVPLRGARDIGKAVEVAFDKSTVKDSPNIAGDGQLNEEEEERLYSHYGLPYRRKSSAVEGIFEFPESDSKSANNSLSAMQEKGSVTMYGEVTPEAAQAVVLGREQELLDEIDASDNIDLRGLKVPHETDVRGSTDAKASDPDQSKEESSRP